jgi:hypothetical protein
MDGAHPYQSKSDEELFDLAFRDDSELDEDYEAESAWAAMRVSRERNTPEVFALAVKCCASPTPRHRERGLQILARIVWGSEEHPRFFEALEFVIAGTRDADETVVEAATWALARLEGDRSKGALIQFKNHSNAEIRYNVAVGLNGGYAPGAIPVLLELMEDPDDKVREWATFALGMKPVIDTSEIREALRKRLSDPCEDVRLEAIWALALREDQQGLKLLLDRLEADSWLGRDEDAASDILGLRSSQDPTNEQLCDGLRALLAS